MKRKIATLVTLVLSISLLGGCGGNANTETANTANSSSNGVSKFINTKSTALSECLSEKKVIGYVVDSVDKAEIPETIYFFNDGKVTIIPGKEFGLTMGDFAQMKDDEIWEKYTSVKENYIATSENEKMSAFTDIQNEKIQSKEERIVLLGEIKTFLLEGNNDNMFEMLDILYTEAYVHGQIDEEEYGRLMDTASQCGENQPVDVQAAIALCEQFIADEKDKQSQLQASLDTYEYPVCFVDLPFAFVVTTDASGNNVQSESMIYPTLEYFFDADEMNLASVELPRTLYASLDFALGLTREEQIYDTAYNCIALSKSGSFLTREVMDIDTLDGKNILIDLTSDEKNALFKEEVLSRYE